MEVEDPPQHEFKITFSFENASHTARLTIVQKEDHDEYHIVPDDDLYVKKYGSQTIDNYFDQIDPLRCEHGSNEYTEAITKGVQAFLNSKHS